MKQVIQRIKLAYRILKSRDGGTMEHTSRELETMGYFDGDPMNREMAQCIIDLVRVFASQGHSGFSESYCRHLFNKAAGYQPLGPIMGSDEEWQEVGEGMFQNRRCGHVFRDATGYAYDIDAVVFEEPDGSRFTGYGSKQPVVFPYTPRRVTVKLLEGASDDQRLDLATAAWAV